MFFASTCGLIPIYFVFGAFIFQAWLGYCAGDIDANRSGFVSII
jgi:hypothetical protein